MEKFSELCKEFDNYLWFAFGCGAAFLAASLPKETASVLLVLVGIAIEKAKKD